MATYQATLEYLYAKLPMYQRVGAAAFKKDLHNTLELMRALDRPHLRFPSVHIAGTNGKGSVAHCCASVLQAAGYRVGLYTSPHLKDFRERIRLNGIPLSEDEVVEFVSTHRTLIERLSPSFFEVTVAMAFERFAHWEVDIAVVETGLGGRLDSTNVILPLVSVITSIGHDHQAMLGSDLPSIAAEKAGIIKPGVPVIIGEFNEETYPVFRDKSALEQAPLYLAERSVSLEQFEPFRGGWQFQWRAPGASSPLPLSCPLGGAYQKKNFASVLQTLLVLEEHGFALPEHAIKTGFAEVRQRTGFRGRWDILQEQPLLIVDGAHNPEGLQALFQQVEQMRFGQLHIVMGTVNDKDLAPYLSCFPDFATYYFARPDIPRGLNALVLQENARAFGLTGSIFPGVAAALETALDQADPQDLILVCGSLFVVAEVPYERFPDWTAQYTGSV